MIKNYTHNAICKKKIFRFLPWFYHNQYNLTKKIYRKANFTIYLLIDSKEYNEKINIPYIKIKELGTIKIFKKKFNFINYCLNFLHLPSKIYPLITHYLRKGDILELSGEVEFFYFFFTYLISRIKKFKYTLHLSQVSTHTWYSKNVIVRFLSKIVVRNSSGIITMTEKAKQRLYKIKYLPSKNLIPKMVIGQPIDTNIFKPFSKTQVANIKSKLCINEKTKIILFVGKITPQKGLHVLIKSLNILNRQFNKDNFKLFVIGKTYTIKDDNYKEFLKKLIKKYDLNSKIEWLGYQSREKIIQFYNISNVLILPSIKLKKENTEAFGIVLVESMACQTPVIGSKLGGMKEIIKHKKNGFLFSPNNYCELSKYINMILFDKNLEQKMGKNGRNYVINNYSFSAILNKYLDFYKSLI